MSALISPIALAATALAVGSVLAWIVGRATTPTDGADYSPALWVPSMSFLGAAGVMLVALLPMDPSLLGTLLFIAAMIAISAVLYVGIAAKQRMIQLSRPTAAPDGESEAFQAAKRILERCRRTVNFHGRRTEMTWRDDQGLRGSSIQSDEASVVVVYDLDGTVITISGIAASILCSCGTPEGRNQGSGQAAQ